LNSYRTMQMYFMYGKSDSSIVQRVEFIQREYVGR